MARLIDADQLIAELREIWGSEQHVDADGVIMYIEEMTYVNPLQEVLDELYEERDQYDEYDNPREYGLMCTCIEIVNDVMKKYCFLYQT